jgi:hypothetical protein
MNVYQFSHYDKNRTIPFCPMDTKKLWRDNSRKYPNDKTTQYYTENPIEYKFNNYGFRTPDDFNDDEGNIFLGCSHTIGIGHHLENTWSYKLNQSLGGKFWNLSQGGNGKHAKRFLGNMFVEQSLVDDKVAQINYDKSILAIQSMAKKMNCNYYFLDEKVMDFKDEASIKARDFEHYTINQQNHLYQNFLKII